MATPNTSNDREESRSRRTSSSSSSARRGKGVSTETIIDIVERLGVVDLLVDRLKARIQEVDTDDLMHEVTDYLKRNPEVPVVALATITIAAGVIVFLSRREAQFGASPRVRREAFGGDEADESESTRRTAQAAARRRT